jgi:hypothetical protein
VWSITRTGPSRDRARYFWGCSRKALILQPVMPLAIAHDCSRTAMSSDSQSRVVPPSHRRDKPIVSCTLCRRRKLKCDRQSPCKTCVDRGLALSCTYVRSIPAAQKPKAPHSVHDRIDQLEKLVTSLMSVKDVNCGTPTTPAMPHLQRFSEDNDAEILTTPDRVRSTGDTTSYTNSAHWASILDGVRSV